MAFGRLYTNVYITKLFSEVCGMANGIRFVAESPDWRRGLLWAAIPASASAWRDRHTSPERKRRDSGPLGETGNDCWIARFRFHADWHGKRDPLRRGVPRLASGAFMGRHPGVGFGLA